MVFFFTPNFVIIIIIILCYKFIGEPYQKCVWHALAPFVDVLFSYFHRSWIFYFYTSSFFLLLFKWCFFFFLFSFFVLLQELIFNCYASFSLSFLKNVIYTLCVLICLKIYCNGNHAVDDGMEFNQASRLEALCWQEYFNNRFGFSRVLLNMTTVYFYGLPAIVYDCFFFFWLVTHTPMRS